MFNYLKIAQYIIDIIVDDFNDKNPSEDIPTPFPQLNNKFTRNKDDIKEWFLYNQTKIIGEGGFTKNKIDILFWCSYACDNLTTIDQYSNGNLRILPLKLIKETTHIESVLDLTDNLILLNDYYKSHFVQHDLLTWINRLLHIFYTDLPIDDIGAVSELKEKFKLTDDDITLIKQLKNGNMTLIKQLAK